MTEKEIIKYMTEQIHYHTYIAEVLGVLKDMGFDVAIMEHDRNINVGKAFGFQQALTKIAGIDSDNIFEQAREEARDDIKKTNYGIVPLLNLAGFDGPTYYKFHSKEREN